jgi:DNA processing protein
MPTDDLDIYWLALRLIPGLGPRRAVPLLQSYRSPQAIFRASASELMGAGLPGTIAQSIASGCTFEDASEQLRLMKKSGVELLSYLDQRYPERLRELFDPPVLLFALGRIELISEVAIAIVGTRRPTAYGVAAAERITTDLALQGAVIVSGMARGIDTVAHRAALNAQGDTVAVFGSGIDHIYPAENKKLAAEIASRGLILSEFPMSNPGHPQNFPIRNRIVSGLSAGVVIVEGAQYSGSAITARLAMDQGREVFAVPGNITSKMSWGPNLLIKQGAHLVQSAEDVINGLAIADRQALAAKQAPTPGEGARGSDGLDLREALGPQATLAAELLRNLLPDEGTALDDIVEKLDGPDSPDIISVLFHLEMLGLVRQLPGKKFVKVWGESSRAEPASLLSATSS